MVSLAREGATRAGVYFLTGVDAESGNAAVYVGEAESLRDRLRGHVEQGLPEPRDPLH